MRYFFFFLDFLLRKIFEKFVGAISLKNYCTGALKYGYRVNSNLLRLNFGECIVQSIHWIFRVELSVVSAHYHFCLKLTRLGEFLRQRKGCECFSHLLHQRLHNFAYSQWRYLKCKSVFRDFRQCRYKAMEVRRRWDVR